jgi:NADPH-dependent glutamate synthase beta subunit-like oxidoreductase
MKLILKGEKDLPETPLSLSTMDWNLTGAWKNIEPFYLSKTPPCNAHCLTNQDIVIQLALCQEGRYEEALEVLRKRNPFPAIVGRVCPHPCEDNCNRKSFGGAIAISKVERFLGDWGIENNIKYQPITSKNKHIAIMGGGPAGLSSAFYLGLMGYNVTVFEAEPFLGGLLRTGIPAYRLPKDVLDAELKIFEELPVEFRCNARLGKDINLPDLSRYDATLIAIGRYSSPDLGILGEDNPQVFSGIKLLREINLGKKVEIGKRVAVIGGGNTAIDCARSLLRLGCKPQIVYRRTEAEMPAIRHEIEYAKEEGIEITFLAAPSKIIISGKMLKELEVIKMRLGEKDASGRPRPIPIPGSEYRIKVDAVVKALGETLDRTYVGEILTVEKGAIKKGQDFRTSNTEVFAAGDCAGGEGTVGAAIRDGRRAALFIDAYLESGTTFKEISMVSLRGGVDEVVEEKDLNPAYIKVLERKATADLEIDSRILGFDEVEKGFDKDSAIYEASRCISCGTCTGCDNCRLFCADNAICLKDSRYEIDYNYCKGCGVCAEECPRGAIGMRFVVREK